MPGTDPNLPTWGVTYTIAPFTGAPNQVTNVAPLTVAVLPPANPGSTSVTADPHVACGIVVSGGVNLAITLTDNSRSAIYTPLGLGVQTGTAPASPTVFPVATISGTTITLTDYDTPGSDTSYEFLMLFQSGTNGNFGALDPKISNL